MFECKRKSACLLIALSISGCQSTDSDEASSWSGPFLARQEEPAFQKKSVRTDIPENTRAAGAAIWRGAGKFIGEHTPTIERTTEAQTGEGVTLNLFNVPVTQAAKVVLGDILSVRYTVDPGIEGKITIQTPKAISKDELVDLFQAALRSNGVTVVENNEMYRIVPIERAALGASIQVGGKQEEITRLGSRVRAVQLKYVSASEIRRVLEPIVPRGSIVRTDQARNLIMLSGSDQEIDNMLETISLFDVDVMKGMSFALLPVTTSQPDVIVDELRSLFASDQDGPMAGMIKFLPNKRLKAILVISPQRAYIGRAEAWIRKLDARAAGSEKQFFTYSVQNRRAQELVDVVQSLVSRDSTARAGMAGRNVSPQYRERKVQSASSSFTAGHSSFPSSLPSESIGRNSLSGPASSLSTQGGASVGAFDLQSDVSNSPSQERPGSSGSDPNSEGASVKIVADEAKNAILIEATKNDYRRIARLIESLDVMPTQVLIEATIAEITLNDELKFGVRWYLSHKNSSFTFSDAANGAVSSAFPGFSYALTASKLVATINALNSITDVNVISSPTLTALDSRTAYLQIGDQVPITTQSATSVLTAGAPVVNSITYKDTGVILSITPRINESGRVLLDIEQEVSSVDSTTTSSIDSPTIHQRRIKTSVVVNNGEGLALGGMIQEGKSISHSQVPIIGDFPVVGNVFKYKDNKITKTELIVIITPHVMRNLNEASAITEEFRKQLSNYAARDYHRPRSIEQSVRRTFE